MKKGKRIALTVSAMALTAAVAVGGTMAYLNSVTETKTNTFSTTKNIVTELTETEWKDNPGQDYYPGKVINKNPVMINDSTEPVYLAIKVTYKDNDGVAVPYAAFKDYASVGTYGVDEEGRKTDTVVDGFDDKWTKLGTLAADGSEIWMYNTTVAAGTSTDALFDNVTVNAGIKKIWNTKTGITTVKKYVDGVLTDVDVTKVEPETDVTYYDEAGKVIADATKLPTFTIDVTGFAVQSTGLDAATAQTELVSLVNSKIAK